MWGAVAKAAADTATSLYNNQQNIHATNLANKQAYERAKEFAQNRIQWTVEDAKKAGIHPLAGLGANVSFGAPSVIPSDNQLDLSSMGQNISNVIDRFQTQDQRDAEEQKAQELADLRTEMEIEKHKQSIKESNARVAESMARTNAILNPVEKVQMKNGVKRSSWSGGAQPRLPARPRIKSGRERLSESEQMGQAKGYGNLMTETVGPNGETVWVPTKETAEVGQNLHGLLELYGYGSKIFKYVKDKMSRAGRYARRSGYFEKALNNW